MTWLTNFLTSSIGRKLLMSLTGLFLCTFLIVHLLGNLQLLQDDGGQAFNIYADFMTSNPLIKFVSIGLYAFILLHAIVGIMLWSKNKKAKGGKYAVSPSNDTSWASKNMALLGTFILAFLLLHMGDFWYKMKFTDAVPLVTYDGVEVKDLYGKVKESFDQLWIVIAYLVGLATLSFHLLHGFASGFQTLGLNHKKYTPIVQAVGKIFAIVIPFVYAIIPIYYHFVMK